MADLFKTLAQAFRKVEHPDKRPKTLKERLADEQERLREEEARWRTGEQKAPRMPGETEAGARVEDCRALTTMLASTPRWRENSTNRSGVGMTVTPPASARVHSPLRSAWAAQCRATREDEHAVSTVIAGPSSPNR